MAEGTIMKALSGFYYVDDGASVYTCRGRGRLRHIKMTPLVGDRVRFTPSLDGSPGTLDEILPRRNEFFRPAVANIDQLVIIASEAVPVTDPFLIDRVAAIAQSRNCQCIICINKCDLADGQKLAGIYQRAGFPTLRISAETGEGLEELRSLITGKVSAFTGNSGVGKSSVLNALDSGIALSTGDVSQKLGRGRHTTRHVELYRLSCSALAADTPGVLFLRCGPHGAGPQRGVAVCLSRLCALPGTMPVSRLRSCEGEGLRRFGGSERGRD